MRTPDLDSLLAGHLKASGLLGSVAGGAFQAGKGFMGLSGKGVMGGLGTVAGVAAPVLWAMRAGQNGPSINTPLGKIGSAEDLLLGYARAKLADGYSPLHRAINVASYGAFALPYLSKIVHDNKALSMGLNIAGLAGLGGTSAHGLAHGDTPSAYDLAGLTLMGGGLLHQHLHGVKPHGG